MKRILFLLLTLLMLVGCTSTGEKDVAPSRVAFYYSISNAESLTAESIIRSEERSFQIFTLKQLLELYFEGPLNENLHSPFPSGTSVVSISEGAEGIEITLSGEFFTLEGIDLSIATCCLANTVCNYMQTDRVILVDPMDRIRLHLTPDDYLLSNTISQSTDTLYTLYFADPGFRYLIAETREVTLSENESPETYLLRQLLAGPVGNLQKVVPEGTRLLGVETSDGICYVNFSKEFMENRIRNDYRAYITVFSIVNTLTNLEDIQSVQFLVEGEPVEWIGIFPLGTPIERDVGSIGPIKANGTEIDTNVYVVREDNAEYFGVPVRVKLSISQPMAEAVAWAVISHESSNGFYNPIPYGTELLSVSVSGDTCYVDLSKEFIPAENTKTAENLAIWALVTSLTELDDINTVMLTIEGESAGLNHIDISQPFTADSLQFY